MSAVVEEIPDAPDSSKSAQEHFSTPEGSDEETHTPEGELHDQGLADAEAAAAEEHLTPEEEAERLAAAERLKQEGNEAYKAGQYEEAALKYAGAIERAPPGAAQQRAVYYANLAACRMAQQDYGEAVTSCGAALELDPAYTKALMRRAAAYEALDDLDHALADYRTALERDKGNAVAARAALRLEPLVKERQERMKEEMMGKLKDLGNMVLGKFGLSVDNFKAQKDPSTGSYSINFQR